MEVKKVYVGTYFEDGKELPDITTKFDASYELATIDDLNDWADCGVIFKELVQVNDGLYQWYTESQIDEMGMEDCICEYRKVA